MPDPPRSGLTSALRGIWERNRDLLRNAGSLAATTGLTSLFGFIYWVVAARDFSPQAVGYGSAAVAAMTLLGTIGEFGLGTMLIGELPKRHDAEGLALASIIIAGIGSLILGIAFPFVAGAFGAHYPQLSGSVFRVTLFGVGVALIGMTIVFDDATLGLLRGGVMLTRNLAMSVLKLALLPVAAIVLHDALGVGLVWAWVIGTLASVLPALFVLRRGGSRVFHPPNWQLLRKLGKLAMAHNWLNLAIMTPPRLIPVLVTLVVSPTANAAFYVAWMLASFLFMVPQSLSIMLFAIASATPDVVAEKLRFVLRMSLMVGVPAMVILAVSCKFVLGIFGSSYSNLATFPLILLTLTYIPSLPKTVYIAVCRATERVGRAAIVLSVAALSETVAVVIGGKLGGLNGVAIGYVITQVAEGIFTSPTVIRAARIKPLEMSVAMTTDSVLELSYLERQERGLQALMAIASTAISENRSLDGAAQIWRTGSFGAITSPFSIPKEEEVLAYQERQQAGVDALLSIATPVTPDGTTEKPRSSRKEKHPTSVDLLDWRRRQ
jgi:O-antigen/teichoic acid export membrane protein